MEHAAGDREMSALPYASAVRESFRFFARDTLALLFSTRDTLALPGLKALRDRE